MKNIDMFEYPNNLQNIFDKLDNNNITPIIIGGYVRDFFLNIESKDIDIELYGVASLDKLENILEEFGSVNSVGKSFGVCKLSLKDFEIDFTLPRVDSKISSGHKGFDVEIKTDIDFTTATSRRDFTINAIGYNVKEKKILDPFNGIADLKNRTLKAVNIKSFGDDPLRVLRAAGFCSRLNFSMDSELFDLCKNMCDQNILDELPTQRIYTEIEKILLKSQAPSIGFKLLKELNALKYLSPLNKLRKNDFEDVLNALDRFSQQRTNTKKTNIIIMLSILCYKFETNKTVEFITNLSNEKELIKKVLPLVEEKFKVDYSDSALFKLACNLNIEHFLILSRAIHLYIEDNIFNKLKKRAEELNILNKKAPALLQGRDILAYGIKPSKEYKYILELAYEKQMDLKINTYHEAKEWLKNYLNNKELL